MKKKINFEEGMQELEALVKSLESGQMPLEESFKAYDRAIKLRDSLRTLLDDSEKKIRVLTEDGERELSREDV
ncbi:MAG: exodeoxyribonuclease VII small subunit [Clostridiales bacterium]|nr:exodeoxyribonuclease VII small subunit [Clostridiales bacterium]